MEELLTTREVATWLRLTPETVLAYCDRHDIPYFRLPAGAIRFRRAELEEWIEEQRQNGKQKRPSLSVVH